MDSRTTISNIKLHQNKLYDLSMAVLDWLNYINRISSRAIIEEASLKYPITEYLERKEKLICSQQTPHPTFQQKRIDITWDKVSKIKDIESGKKCWGNYIELKYAPHITLKNVTDDLFRLYYIKKKYPKSKCYFLLFGERAAFNANFQRHIIKEAKDIKYQNGLSDPEEKEYSSNEEQKYAHWFTLQLKHPWRKIRCDGTVPNSIYNKFLNREKGRYSFYNEKEKESEIVFRTRLIQRRSNTNTPDEFCIAIWEIYASK